MPKWTPEAVAEFVSAQAAARAAGELERATWLAHARAQARAVADMLARDFGATRVVLFGSVARGDAGPGSDIDLAVEGLAPARLFDAVGAALALARCGPVDLAPMEALAPHIRARVAAEGVLLHG